MANTYSWQIAPSGLNSLTVDGETLSQVFTTLDWRLAGSDGATPPNIADVYGQAALAAPNPASFVPASSVTSDDLADWLTVALGSADAVAALKSQVDAKIAVLAAPPTFTAAPVAASA